MLGTSLSGEQGGDGELWIQFLENNSVDLFADRHLDIKRLTLAKKFPCRIEAFRLLADGFKRCCDIFSPANGESYAPVSGLIIRAGEDQVTKAGETHKGLGTSAERLSLIHI